MASAVVILASGCGYSGTEKDRIDFFVAAEREDVPELTTLVSRGVSVDIRDESGDTPLMMASAAGQVPSVELLLRRGADPNLKDKGGVTALHDAALYGQTAVVKVLVANGADPNSKEVQLSCTPLMFAARGGFKDTLEALIAGGSRVNDICINNAIIGTEGAQHLCPDRRVAPTCWKTDVGEPWRY
jgi:ankyrin repeat protein